MIGVHEEEGMLDSSRILGMAVALVALIAVAYGSGSPAYADPPAAPTIDIYPETDVNPVNTNHTVTVFVWQGTNQAVGVPVVLLITRPGEPNPTNFEDLTDSNGQLIFTFTSDRPGVSTITAFVDSVDNGEHDEVEPIATATKYWVPTVCTTMTFDRILAGSEDADTLTGTGLRELIYGLEGNDTINGGAGNDCIVGGDGNDTLSGGSGNDRLLGEAGTDTINGDSGTDSVNGGTGTDRCNAESETSCEN